VGCIFLTPLAILFELDLFSDEFLIFARPIVDVFARPAGEFDESVL
jgi:hypothetical protein